MSEPNPPSVFTVGRVAQVFFALLDRNAGDTTKINTTRINAELDGELHNHTVGLAMRQIRDHPDRWGLDARLIETRTTRNNWVVSRR